MTRRTWRLPAEWEPQDGVLLAWPHEDTDWAPNLRAVERGYVELIGSITRSERVLLLAPDAAIESRARAMLAEGGADLARVAFARLEYDDTWLRDSGPVTLRDHESFVLLDFAFTGWGGKFGASRDDRVVEHLHAAKTFGAAKRERIDFALEGGAIECDGLGTILTTFRCLKQRHPDLDAPAMAETLKRHLNAERVLILQHGYLEGDDTDAHIDTLARFASASHIVYQGCDVPGDAHYTELAMMAGELAKLRTVDGAAYALSALPWPRPISTSDGRRLAASYANFLIVNGAVLMPSYGDPADDGAARVLAEAFPGREVVRVNCRALIEQNGSLHCVTMQLPKGAWHS
jgi:agmatine/peptidylarginine deiminase